MKEKLHFETVINAPREKVFKTMLEKPTYEAWTSAFQEGSTYEGDWNTGSKIMFTDGNKDGMMAEIVENKPNEFVSIRHLGEIKKGVIDTESDEVKMWAGNLENYTFTDVDGQTKVDVDVEVAAQFKDMFNGMWDKALVKLKEVCEAN